MSLVGDKKIRYRRYSELCTKVYSRLVSEECVTLTLIIVTQQPSSSATVQLARDCTTYLLPDIIPIGISYKMLTIRKFLPLSSSVDPKSPEY